MYVCVFVYVCVLHGESILGENPLSFFKNENPNIKKFNSGVDIIVIGLHTVTLLPFCAAVCILKIRSKEDRQNE